MKITSFVEILALPLCLFSQEWTARYNGTGDSLDGANAIAVDNAGNVYVTGRSFGIGTGEDFVTIKYDAAGTQQWTPRYNGPVGSYDNAFAIAIDDSVNVYVTGRSYGVGTYYDYATIKYNSAGAEQWVQRYNGPGNSYDEARAIAVDTIGNVYVTGWSYDMTTSDDYTTIKYDALGTQQWTPRYNGPGNGSDAAKAIAIDSAGNVYVTGASFGGATDVDYATVKYNTSGVEQWARRYNGPGNSSDEANGIAVDNAGNTYVTGTSYGSGTYYDYATVKYNAAGTQQWVMRYDGPSSGPDYGYALDIDNAGNIYVTGRSYDNGGFDYDYAVVKYDSAGNELWARRYNGPGNSYDEAYAIAVDNAGNVFVTGRSVGSSFVEDYATVKYTPSGVQQWVGRYDGPGNDIDIANAVAVDNAGNIYVTGESFGAGTNLDYATLKYLYTVHTDEQTGSSLKEKNFAGPSIVTGPLKFPSHPNCKLYNITGREVKPYPLPPGIYFLRVNGDFAIKIIKIE